MIKNKINKKKKQVSDIKPDYKIEFEKLKEELDEHEKNLEILKKEIASLKKIIKLGGGNIARPKNAG